MKNIGVWIKVSIFATAINLMRITLFIPKPNYFFRFVRLNHTPANPSTLSFCNFNNRNSQRQLDDCNGLASEVMPSTKPARHVGGSTVGEKCKFLFTDALFFHHRIDAACDAFRYRIGFPFEISDAVVGFLNEWAINLSVDILSKIHYYLIFSESSRFSGFSNSMSRK